MRLFFVCPPAFAKASAGKPGPLPRGHSFCPCSKKNQKVRSGPAAPPLAPSPPGWPDSTPRAFIFALRKWTWWNFFVLLEPGELPRPERKRGGERANPAINKKARISTGFHLVIVFSQQSYQSIRIPKLPAKTGTYHVRYQASPVQASSRCDERSVH